MLRRILAPVRILVAAMLLAALLYPYPARCEVRVAGKVDGVRVDTKDAPIEEVLSVLHASFGLQYRSATMLDRRVSGTYEGSLQRVVRRLLEGYDFVLKTQSGTLEVMIIGAARPGEARSGPTVVPRRRSE